MDRYESAIDRLLWVPDRQQHAHSQKGDLYKNPSINVISAQYVLLTAIYCNMDLQRYVIKKPRLPENPNAELKPDLFHLHQLCEAFLV